MFVNIAHRKSKGLQSVHFEGMAHNMESLSRLLKDKYVQNKTINANTYWVVIDFLEKNGYAYYVKQFNKYAIKSFAMGVLGLVSLCCYDVSLMQSAFTEKLHRHLAGLEYAMIIRNFGTEFDLPLSAAEASWAEFNNISEQINRFSALMTTVAEHIKADINEEWALIQNIEPAYADGLPIETYITSKQAYTENILAKARAELVALQNYVAGAMQYYTNYIQNYARIAAARITQAFCYIGSEGDTIKGFARIRLTPEDGGHCIEKLSQLPPTQLEAIEKTICEPKSTMQGTLEPSLDLFEATPFYQVHHSGGKFIWHHFAAGGEVGSINFAEATVSWWRQCGLWGQWLYTYCEADGMLQKWEIRFAQEENRFKTARVWHAFVGRDLSRLEVTDEHLKAESADGTAELYPNNLRYAVIERHIELPGFYANISTKAAGRLKKWKKHLLACQKKKS